MEGYVKQLPYSKDHTSKMNECCNERRLGNEDEMAMQITFEMHT